MMRVCWLLLTALAVWAQPGTPTYPNQIEGDWLARDFVFHTGESLPELRMHYLTIGQPALDSTGHVRNAVLILHGTGGSGSGFLRENFGGQLFGPGKPLDAARHYLILPDGIGHGKSSKPSDGRHARFPHYDYEDMVRAEFRLLREGLQVDHLRLLMGTSMGAMHTWVWGYLYPDAMDALMPLASAPVEIAGRNRMFRSMIIQAIRNDPDWKGGEYTVPPMNGLMAAEYALWMMTSSPLQLQKVNPTPDEADAAVAKVRKRAREVDANDMLYQFEASRDYNPEPHLGEIRAPLWVINSADDEVNPPELGQVARNIEKVQHGRYILIPTSEETRGHGTHSQAAVWKQYLVELLQKTEGQHASH
jgi:homoserine O-acetyltransferase